MTFTTFIISQISFLPKMHSSSEPHQSRHLIKSRMNLQSITWHTHSLAAVLPYYSIHINNSWCKITSFKIIPSRAECDIHTHYRHFSSKNYTIITIHPFRFVWYTITFEILDLWKVHFCLFWYYDTSSESRPTGHDRMWRSSDQGQGQRSQNSTRVIRLLFKGILVYKKTLQNCY